MLLAGSIIFAINMNTFIAAGDLVPGGFSGLSILIQSIFEHFLHISLPFSVLNITFNVIPAVVAFRLVGKRFTILSCVSIFLSSILVDLLPKYDIVNDPLLISVFGAICGGIGIVLVLNSGASSGGTDFIAMSIAAKFKSSNGFNYVLYFSAAVILTYGILFGMDKALYSILFQYASTQMIRMMDPDGRRSTLLIVAEKEHVDEICALIRNTHHSATLLDGVGMYNGTPCTMIYSVVEDSLVRSLSHQVREIDPKAFVNVLRTEKVVGKFYRRPRD